MMQLTGMLETAAVAMMGSLGVSLLIIATQGWHGKHSMDFDMDGAQKFHESPVPRIGGVALLCGILIAAIYKLSDTNDFVNTAGMRSVIHLVVAATPVFIAGLIEDLTKQVSAGLRLLASFASAFLACWLLNASLPRLDIWGIDQLMVLAPIAIMITAFAVAGVTNSINIIDGFHGLASSAVALILAGMAVLTWKHGDTLVATLALAGAGAAIGFLCTNYPTGRIFMGDGGADLLGFWAAEVAVLAIARNNGISAWQVLAIYAYPVIEVLYSAYRKKVIRKMSPGIPDRLHMHMLIYRRLSCIHLPRSARFPWLRNATVAWFTAAWIGSMTVLAVKVGDSVTAAAALFVLQLLCYVGLYARLVRGHWCFSPSLVLGLRPAIRRREA